MAITATEGDKYSQTKLKLANPKRASKSRKPKALGMQVIRRMTPKQMAKMMAGMED